MPVTDESSLYGEIMRALSRDATRLFRQQSGLFWTGRVIEHTAQRVVLLNPRAVKVGTPGMSDLGGITSVIITPDMVGRTVGIDVQIEVKSNRGRVTPEQAAYLSTLQSLGARAGIARSVDDAARIIKNL